MIVCVFVCVCLYSETGITSAAILLTPPGGEVSECSIIYLGLSYKNSIYFPSNTLNTTNGYFISNL